MIVDSITFDRMDRASVEGISDEDLMQRFAQDDYAAFETLYRRHRGGLFRFMMRSLGHRQTAEELFQDVWTRVIDARARYQPSAKFQTYLYRIAQNRLIDHYRANRTSTVEDIEGLADAREAEFHAPEPTGHRVDVSALGDHLKQAISDLPLDQRTAFLLQAERGMSLEEIAVISGVGRETIKSRLRYAMNKLRAALGVCYEQSV